MRGDSVDNPGVARWARIESRWVGVVSLLAAVGALACSERPRVVVPTRAGDAVDEGGSSVGEALPNEVPVDPLVPAPITVRIDELPAPFATDSAQKSPDVVPMPPGARLSVPKGFRVQIFADGLERPRWLALAPDGAVLVTETRENRIRRLEDRDGDGAVDERSVFADAGDGVDIPFGMAFGQGAFFLGNSDEVLRYGFSDEQRALEGAPVRIATLPGGGYNQHWTRNVVVSPDKKKLFVSIGSASNADVEELPRASIQEMNLDGTEQRTWAHGLRNPVGLAFHPATGELYTTVNERDGLGDDLVPDFFTRVRAGEFYGWPFAYLDPGHLDPRRTRDGRSERPDLVAKTQTPDVLFQAHSAALGLVFYEGGPFPARYHQGAFVAFRGSWNRDSGTGYKLVFIPFEGGRPVGHYEDFLTGFLVDPEGPTTWGRPVGLLALPDGSLLFTEEMNGRIFRVSYPADV